MKVAHEESDMTEAATVLPPTTRPGRIALAVEDLYGISSFYEDVVGLELFDYTEETGTLGVGERPLLEIRAGSDRGPRTDAQAGLYHVAFQFPDQTALGSALQRVESFYELSGATDHGISQSLYLTDPAGNGVELYVATPTENWPTNEAGEAVMETQPLDLDAIRSAGAAATEAPEPTRIGHFHLEVTDLEASTAFYETHLGLPRSREIGDMARFFAVDLAHHDLGLTNYQDRSEPATGRGLDWIEFVSSAEAIEAVRSHIEETDIHVENRTGGITVTDPDGIGVRLTAEESR